MRNYSQIDATTQLVAELLEINFPLLQQETGVTSLIFIIYCTVRGKFYNGWKMKRPYKDFNHTEIVNHF